MAFCTFTTVLSNRVECWRGWATLVVFPWSHRFFILLFLHHNLHLISVGFIWLRWTFIFHSFSPHLVIYSQREARLLCFIVINSINVSCESISGRRCRNWDLKSQTHPPKALSVAEPFPRLSLKSPPHLFPSPIVVQTELHDWAWTLVSQILLVGKKLTTEKTTADVCSFFPSPTKTSLQMMSYRGEDKAFGVRAVLHNRRHTQLNFFFFL